MILTRSFSNAFCPNAPALDRFSYLPFGLGPRVCIGAHLALIEMTLAVALIVRSFRIEFIESRPVLPVLVVTTQPDHAPRFRLRRR
jgi:cytochrome P450